MSTESTIFIGVATGLATLLAWQWMQNQSAKNPGGAKGSGVSQTGAAGSNLQSAVQPGASVSNPNISANYVGSSTFKYGAGLNNNADGTGLRGARGTFKGGKLTGNFQQRSKRGGAIPTSNRHNEAGFVIQTTASRPFANGNNAAYMDAWNSSPTDPAYAVNGDASLATVDTSTWND